MSTRRTSGGVNRVKVGILIGGTIIVFLIFSTLWSETHKKPEEPQTTQQSTTSVEVDSSAEDSSPADANASTEPVPDNISVNEMQAQINNLNKQLAEKDTTIGDLQNQIQSLQNGTEKIGGLTFREFLNLYFWSDGHVYQMAEDKKLYNNYACTDEYAVNVADYTFSCNRTLPLARDNGITIHMLMTSDGQILWTPTPWLNQIQ